MIAVCDDLWPVIFDVSFVTTSFDLLIYWTSSGRDPLLTVVSVTCNFKITLFFLWQDSQHNRKLKFGVSQT